MRPLHRSQTLDSNGPNIKIRGDPPQIFERYVALAREAFTSGDRVAAENLYQRACPPRFMAPPRWPLILYARCTPRIKHETRPIGSRSRLLPQNFAQMSPVALERRQARDSP